MKYLDVRLRQPDWMLHPMQRFIREEDVVRYEELRAWSIRPESDVEYALYYVEVAGDPGRYRDAIDRVDSIVEYELAPIDDDALNVWVCEETRPESRAWRGAFEDRHLIVVPPVRFDDEAAMGMTIVGDGADIQAVLADLPDAIDVTIDEIGTYDRRGGTVAGALTERQLDAIDTALAIGYYAVPRDASLADVADALDCAESTASVLLRRAERELFSRVLDRYGGAIGRGRRTDRSSPAR
ncbi:helix-turn-helix domain-containing protein [Halosolutus halophilus]|uniref:helix-turn-helix domain-containing protein n=1 Tax=Halosolutus halophilus TaxID=1552990 RepID=UPI002234FE5E|nr:helix-turn-helix domain-containing protein [Halosolutus halophilus]